MHLEKTGAVISRGLGLGLIIMGASALLSLLQNASPVATSEWTSYSPDLGTTTTKDAAASLHGTYYVFTSMAMFYLPSVAQAVGGFVMILLSRPIGRWLARGLNDGDVGE